MINYIIALGLLFHGVMFMRNRVQVFDSQYHQKLLNIGGMCTVIFFITGFFIFPWFAPFIGLIAIPLILALIHFYLVKYDIFIMFKNQISILIGMGLGLYSLISTFLNTQN